MIRTALITGTLGTTAERVAAYLPANYKVVDADITGRTGDTIIIQGTDNAGWTLDGYVLPRLASGLMFGVEVEV